MGFNFFEQPELPAPALDASEVVDIAEREFGLGGSLTELGSQQDQNFLLHSANQAVVIKVVNPAFSAAEIAAQDAAATVVAGIPGVRAAQPRASARVQTSAGELHVRAIEYLPGGTLNGSHYLGHEQIAALGRLAGKVSVALADFAHPGLERTLQWNLEVAERVVELLIDFVPNDRKALVHRATRAAGEALARVSEALPRQAGHFDLTDDNVVLGQSGLVDGVIDFGDVSQSWAIGELATTLTSVLHHADAEPVSVLPGVLAFNAERPISEVEADALWPLVVLRAAALVVSGCQQMTLDPGNAYAEAGAEREWRMFEQATSEPLAVMTGLIRHSLGLSTQEQTTTADWQSVAELAEATELNLEVTSPLLSHGAWLKSGLRERLAAEQSAATGGPVVSPAWVAQLDGSPVRARRAPATVPTGVSVFAALGLELRSPSKARVARAAPGQLKLELHDGSLLGLDGVTSALSVGAELAAGENLGTAAEKLTITWAEAGVDLDETPARIRPDYHAGWRSVLRDPAVLLGRAASPLETAAERAERTLALREAHFAEVQEHYFERPPQIERGWMNHLIGTDGRVYLDMVNNVTSIGHGHPGLAEAVNQQLLTLNTNSRFHYGAVAEFSEALAATLPDPLDTVFLVNSGSEAVDMAIRVAMAATDRRDIVSVLEAYHGWTFASDAVSTSIADNPNALESRPDWVHPVTAPNTFRGPYTDNPGQYAKDAVAEIDRLVAGGTPPAAFLVESWYGNAGGVQLPDGYLSEVYAAVRAAGGLAIADEVQVGYGRLGKWFWGFEQQGAVPDIVAVAKSMGNGYPLAAVITTRAIAAKFRSQGYFFASTGGSPVSSVVGLTVLREVQGGLQANALETGEYLRARLNELGERYPMVGAVHGHGFYLGLEFVRDRRTLEPATAETALVCNRLRELGVIMQPTGDYQNVLKIKPPLVTTRADVDFFVDTLDHVLASSRW